MSLSQRSRRMNTRAKVTLMVVSGVIVGLLLAVMGWVRVNSRDIAPPDVSDLLMDTVEVSDEDNAFTCFREAAEKFEWPADESRVNSILLDGEWDDAFVADLLSRNAETLAQLGRGLTCPAYQPYGDSTSRPPTPSFLWADGMSWLMTLKAMQEQRAGRTERIWQSCFDQCRLGSLIAAHPRATVEYMLGLIVLARGFDEAERLLRESSPDEAELVELLNQLNRIGPQDQGLVRVVKAYFQFLSDAIDNSGSGTARASQRGGRLLRPNRTKDTCAQFCRTVIQDASRPYTQVHLPVVQPVRIDGIHRYLLFLRPDSEDRLFVKLLLSPDQMKGLLTSKCNAQGHLDGLRLVVACLLYEIRHGQLPETLDALVPEYLGEVPRDPFDGKPFRYLPTRAAVYCVGADLTDSFASTGPASDAHLPELAPRSSDDLVYPIHAKAR